MYNFILILCFSIGAILMALIMLTASYILSYKSASIEKSSTYECGLAPIKDAHIQFNIEYFYYIILFMLIEASSIFLYPICVVEMISPKTLIIKPIVFLMLLLIAIVNGITKLRR